MNQPKKEDRRQYKRWLLSCYFDVFPEGSEQIIGHLADISYGGLQLISRYPIQTHILMPLSIRLNTEINGSRHMRVVSNMVRCNRDTDQEFYRTGCKLIDLSSGNLKMIEKLIALYAQE